MIRAEVNRERNRQLSALYLEHGQECIDAYAEAFRDDDPPDRINEFGIIDENRYDTDKGILFVAKETNGWSNEELEGGLFIRDWLRHISANGVAGMGHVQRHPTIWYNLGRWAMYLGNRDLSISYIRACKREALSAIGTIAFTNVNKVRGYSLSKDEYWAVACSEAAGKMLRAELDILKPKVIVCCGTAWEVRQHIPDYDGLILDMPHPGARKNCEGMLRQLAEQYSEAGIT